VFRAPPSQMTSGHKLDVNLTVLRNFGGSGGMSAFEEYISPFYSRPANELFPLGMSCTNVAL